MIIIRRSREGKAMSLTVVKGQKMDLTKSKSDIELVDVKMNWHVGKDMEIDASAFMIGEKGEVVREEDFVFYGQPVSSCGSVRLEQLEKPHFVINLTQVPLDVQKIVFTLTIDQPEATGNIFASVSEIELQVINDKTKEVLTTFPVTYSFTNENAIVLGTLYRHAGEWKYEAVGAGYFGGLADLCTEYGVEVSEPSSTEPVKEDSPPQQLSTVSLLKKKVRIVLEKKQIQHVTAKVGLVLDISGSMRKLYNDGTVQKVVDRILAVASQFDDDGALDVWIYDNEFTRLPQVTEKDFAGYVNEQILTNDTIHKFGRNDEPKVMKDVLQKYLKEEPSELPIFLVFINDGGCKSGIKKFIVGSSDKPIFWQFVGVGDANFDVLRKLDTMDGRMIDNANFFHFMNIETVSDEELYDQLLNEFPMWLREAKQKSIVK